MLPELDKEFLDEKGFNFEVRPEGGFVNIVIHDYQLPATYKPAEVDCVFRT